MNEKIHIELFPLVFKDKLCNLFMEMFSERCNLKYILKSSKVLNNILKMTYSLYAI